MNALEQTIRRIEAELVEARQEVLRAKGTIRRAYQRLEILNASNVTDHDLDKLREILK